MEDCETVAAFEELLGDMREEVLPVEAVENLKNFAEDMHVYAEDSETSPDLVQAISKYRKAMYARNGKVADLMKNTVDTLAVMYKSADEAEKPTILEALYLKFIFVLISELKRKHSINRQLFNDAIQNVSVRLLAALKAFDPQKSKSLAHYNLGFFLSALSDTFSAAKVITVHRIKRKNSKKRYVPELQVDSYPVTTSYFDEISGTTLEVGNGSEITDYIESKEWNAYLYTALDPKNHILTELESQVLRRCFGLGDYEESSYREIAEASNGSSCSRICQIQKKALQKVQRFFLCCGVQPDI